MGATLVSKRTTRTLAASPRRSVPLSLVLKHAQHPRYSTAPCCARRPRVEPLQKKRNAARTRRRRVPLSLVLKHAQHPRHSTAPCCARRPRVEPLQTKSNAAGTPLHRFLHEVT